MVTLWYTFSFYSGLKVGIQDPGTADHFLRRPFCFLKLGGVSLGWQNRCFSRTRFATLEETPRHFKNRPEIEKTQANLLMVLLLVFSEANFTRIFSTPYIMEELASPLSSEENCSIFSHFPRTTFF